MASTTFFKSGSGGLRRFFRAIGDSMVIAMERHSRLDQVQKLRDMSDEDLARMGLRRDDIVAHVFRDRMHV